MPDGLRFGGQVSELGRKEWSLCQQFAPGDSHRAPQAVRPAGTLSPSPLSGAGGAPGARGVRGPSLRTSEGSGTAFPSSLPFQSSRPVEWYLRQTNKRVILWLSGWLLRGGEVDLVYAPRRRILGCLSCTALCAERGRQASCL